LQRSQRYCNDSDAQFITPESLADNREYSNAIEYAVYTYNELVAAGIKKEDARMVLPASTTTELVVTGNFQAWLDFINLRNTKEAQWEIRALAQEIKSRLEEIAPNIFGE
tara:strand:- start:1833 stop:2162 length:330 start_codon:yes stop_codon:yes gene_type:complete